jgi:hypothetical protein
MSQDTGGGILMFGGGGGLGNVGTVFGDTWSLAHNALAEEKPEYFSARAFLRRDGL